MLVFSLRSLWNRRFSIGLTILAISLSVALILGVERLRDGARDSFTNSASGIDLIVAPRGNSVQILMATVFGIGGTGTGMTWDSYEWLETRPEVAWAVPIQMGDTHRGYPVLGTSAAYFEHFRHSGGQGLVLALGHVFDGTVPDVAVIGAEVASRFGYVPGDVIVNTHGMGSVSFHVHDDAPFTISGVLAPTGTAVDRMVFVTLEGFDAIHAQPEPTPVDPFSQEALAEANLAGSAAHADQEAHDSTEDHASEAGHGHDDHDGHYHVSHNDPGPGHDHGHVPDRINAVYVGLTDRTAVLSLQRAINERPADALSAVLPAAALAELWSLTGTAERAMRLMAWCVAAAGLLGMIAMLSAALDARRREFAILRSIGATPARIFGLIVTEAALVMIAGLVLGAALLALVTLLAEPVLTARFGVRLDAAPVTPDALSAMALIFCAGLAASCAPAMRVYRMTLADGLAIRN
ncbi:ABC transporter permease [Marivita sp. S0852]|uniref:ABC transporter permease n=1 Tax=Marivita sp. S0852 TaxID=3373893 RepID=UPI00398277C8